MKLLLGTTNRGKIVELRAALTSFPLEILTPLDLGLDREPLEGAASYVENALIKALYYHRETGLPTLAEDSGLEIDALAGLPGAMSRRIAGEDARDIQRIALVLAKMKEVPAHQRTARFRSVVALVIDLAHQYLFSGTVEGTILEAPRGSGGFGYDPIFYVPSLGRSMAELSLEDKNKVSHRGRAMARLSQFLAGWLRVQGRIVGDPV